MIKVPKKILIVKLNRLGDTVVFLPTLKAIREGWPESHLTLLTTTIGKELIEGSNIADEIWVADNKEVKSFYGISRLLKIFRRNRFDIAIASSDSSSFIALLFFLSSIPVRIGFTNPKLSFLFNHKISFSKKITHLELNLQLAKYLGFSLIQDRLYPFIQTPEEDKKRISGRLKGNGIQPSTQFAVLHVCSNRPSHKWPVERYAEVVKFLAEKYSIKTVCVGGKEEKETVSLLLKMLNNQHAVDLCLETNLKQLIYLISLANLFIGHSSGPLHIAYMLGIPTVSFWGASALDIWGPVFDKEKHVCLKADLDCLHCEKVACPKKTLECMELIKTDTVKQAIAGLLAAVNRNTFDKALI